MVCMSDIADRYRRLSGQFAETVAAVDPDRWSDPSPCEEWTARGVVQHVVDSQSMFLGLVGRSAEGIPSVEDDPLAAFLAASSLVQADLDDEQRAGVTFEGFAGTSRFDAAVDRFVSFDLVVHRWDLARAVGLDDTIDDAEVERLMTVDAPAFGDMLRGPGVVGPEVEVPADASAQDRLIAYLGRRP